MVKIVIAAAVDYDNDDEEDDDDDNIYSLYVENNSRDQFL